MALRRPGVAGVFYPAGAEECAAAVARCLAGGRPSPPGEPKAIVAPHAGLAYSGPIAGTAFAPLFGRRARIRRAVVFGPAHRADFQGMATTSADAWASPLGIVPVDREAVGKLLALPRIRTDDRVFAGEHSLEVQIPFLQHVLDDFAIVPVLVGDARPGEVTRVMRMLWGGPETLILISSDLSHFHEYEDARRIDGGTATLVELLQPERIDDERACGHLALGAALGRARALDMRVTALDIRNSGDTAGGRDRVVGYGAFAMEYAESARLPDGDRARLLDAARASLAFGAGNGRAMRAGLDSGLSPALTAIRASFVTLLIGGRLKGCGGSVTAARPLLLDVVAGAYKAGFDGTAAISAEELARANIEISVLSTPRPIRFADDTELARKLRPDVDGLILQDGERRSLFLPSVWQGVRRPEEFVKQLKRKAGLPPDHRSDSLRVFGFTAETFGGRFRGG